MQSGQLTFSCPRNILERAFSLEANSASQALIDYSYSLVHGRSLTYFGVFTLRLNSCCGSEFRLFAYYFRPSLQSCPLYARCSLLFSPRLSTLWLMSFTWCAMTIALRTMPTATIAARWKKCIETGKTC